MLFAPRQISYGWSNQEDRSALHVAWMGRGEVHTEFLVGKPEGRRPLGRPMHRWEDNIKMDVGEVG